MPEDINPTENIPSTPDTGTNVQPDTGISQPEPQPSSTDTPSDWRIEKYGEDWKNSLQYYQDTNKYLRGELDKAKRRPQRSVEESISQPQPSQPQSQPADPYADIKNFDDMFSHVDQRVQRMLSAREQEANFRASIRAARDKEQGDPKRGIPSFSQLEQDVLIPAIEKNPAIKTLVREAFGENAGQALYTLGFLLKYNTVDALEKLFAGKAREEFGDKIEEVAHQAVRVSGGREGPTNGRLRPADIWNMSKEEFAKLEARNTGRIP